MKAILEKKENIRLLLLLKYQREISKKHYKKHIYKIEGNLIFQDLEKEKFQEKLLK